MAALIPGLMGPADKPVPKPVQFIGELATPNVVVWKGIRIQVFPADELLQSVSAGDRVRCMFVEDTKEVFVIEKIA